MKKILLLFTAFLFLQITSFTQDGWFWQNPLPQGNHLYDIESLTGLTIAVGSNGTILSSTGSGWQIRDSGADNPLFSVSMYGINAWISGGDGTMLKCSDGVGYLWQEQTTGITDKQLRSVFFVNDTLGWSVGEQEIIIKTTNGGADWQVINTNGSQHYFEVFFHDENNGWLCGAAGTNGVIKKTTNGGTTWQNSIIPTSRLNGMHFADINFGCAVGNGGVIFKTTNGGEDWSLATSNTSQDLKSVYLNSNGEGWAVGYEGTIIYTSDYGANWNAQNSTTNSNLNSVCNGRAAGEGGIILRSTDGGSSWTTSSSGYINHITDIEFVTNSIGYASGNFGKFYRTFNGGDTWEELSVGTSLDFYALSFKKWEDITGVGYIVGRANGAYFTVYRTTDAGDTWIDKSFTIPNIATNLYDCYMMLGKTYVTGSLGVIAKTEDGGNNWEIQNGNNNYDLFTIDFESEYVGWAAGSSGTILKTINGGEDWFLVSPDGESNFKSIYFADLQHGWVVGVGGVIYRTTDGGYNWIKTTPNVTSETLLAVYFTDQNNGWICGTGGVILYTSNGGVNWFLQESGTDNNLNSLNFTETAKGWISGWYGAILNTEDGGGAVTVHSYWRNFLNMSLADPGETSDDMNVIVNPVILNSYTMAGTSVVLDTIFHSNVTDLIFLLSHNGVTDTLVLQPNNPGSDFIGCTLTDASSVPVDEAQAPFTGFYKPHSPLSGFSGMDPNGIWTLKIVDLVSGNTGRLEAWGLKLYFDATTEVESDFTSTPAEIQIFQNYPNPFNTSTRIQYQVPSIKHVTLKVFDILGNEVATIVNEYKPAGKYEVEFSPASGIKHPASGIYFYQLKVGSDIQTKKMILIK
jgi:photosystem II stability/assembly factor-like uncharacterized protein